MHIAFPRGFTIPVALIIMAASATAQTTRLAFDFAGTDPARNLPWTKTSFRETTLTTEGWRFGSGLSLVTARNDRLAFAVSSDANLSTLAQAKANNAYLYVRVAPSSGTLNMANNRARFTIRRESWHAPLQYAVFSSVDNYTSPLFTTPLLDNADDATDAFTFLIPSVGYGNISGPLELRIYAYAARYNGHPASLTAFSLGGAVQTYTLTTSASEGGTVEVSPDGTVFEAGQSVQIIARAAAGYAFAGWSGDLSGTANPALVTMSGNLAVHARFLPKPAPRMDLGGNLDALTDWTTAWVFKDCFKLARTWMTRSTTGGEWESNQTPVIDANGWPQAVPFTANGAQHFLHTLLPLYDAGNYTVRFTGTGRIELIAPNGGGRQIITATGGTTTRIFNFNPTLADNTFYLEVRQSSGSDPIRNIEVIAPRQDTNLQTQPFHTDFVASLAPYRNLRFMDWLRTNLLPYETGREPVRTWSERTTRDSYTQTRDNGVAHEYIIVLANQTGKDPWICIPHEADDNSIRETARLYRDSLAPGLELYVEYSNETWNGGFLQTDYVQDRGEALALDPARWTAGQKFVGKRSGDIFAIVAQEYGAAQRHRFVAVLATQAANAGLSEERLAAMTDPTINTSGVRPDALAIAPYFGINYEPGSAVPTANQVATTLSTTAIAEAVAWTRDQRAVADANGLRLVCYEGGQHFVGIYGAESNSTLTAALHAGNRDARMQDRYREYLTALELEGADLFVHFAHVSGWSQWGSWGALEYQQQPAAQTPKWRALTAWHQDLAQRKEPVRLDPPATNGAPWSANFPLRPGRSYSMTTSTNLTDWLPVAGLDNLRGNSVTSSVSLPASNEPHRFWRLLVTD